MGLATPTEFECLIFLKILGLVNIGHACYIKVGAYAR